MVRRRGLRVAAENRRRCVTSAHAITARSGNWAINISNRLHCAPPPRPPLPPAPAPASASASTPLRGYVRTRTHVSSSRASTRICTHAATYTRTRINNYTHTRTRTCTSVHTRTRIGTGISTRFTLISYPPCLAAPTLRFIEALPHLSPLLADLPMAVLIQEEHLPVGRLAKARRAWCTCC
jgi:hypothetical protein